MIRSVLIGCGHVGKRHAGAISGHDDLHLAAIVDVDEQQRIWAGINYPETLVFETVHDLDFNDIDLVSVCTPHSSHHHLAETALQAGCSVLIEKPMSLSYSDCQNVAKVAAETGLNAWTVKQNRYNPSVQTIRREVESGRIGNLIQVSCNIFWNRSPKYYSQAPWRGSLEHEGGFMFTVGCHFIDLISYISGLEVHVDHSTVRRLRREHEIDDSGSALINLGPSSSAIGSISWSSLPYSRNLEGRCVFIFENATVVLGGTAMSTIEFIDSGYDFESQIGGFELQPNEYGGYSGSPDNHALVYNSVAAAILNGITDNRLASPKEAGAVVRAIERIYSLSSPPTPAI